MRSDPYSYVDSEAPPLGLRPSKRRMRRQRLLETALPCVLITGILIALLFTVGHLGASARSSFRNMARRSLMSKLSMLQLSDEQRVVAPADAPADAPANALATLLRGELTHRDRSEIQPLEPQPQLHPGHDRLAGDRTRTHAQRAEPQSQLERARPASDHEPTAGNRELAARRHAHPSASTPTAALQP